jgi:formylmethanofuran dehydrogenase subunit B
MSAQRVVEHVTCLGCGCGCDDVTVTIEEGRIAAATPLCPLGQNWFGDGRVPDEVLIQGRAAPLDQAIARAAADLAAQRPSLIYLASDITSQTQRAAVEIADVLGATVDTATSDTAAGGLLTAQRRGRASATLGEMRNRGDVFFFWGVDPAERYPRFMARYGPEPAGTHVPQGRSGRTVISVSVGAERGPAGSDLTYELPPEQEISALSLIRASVLGMELPVSSPVTKLAGEIAAHLLRARYAVVVHDAEPTNQDRNPLRIEALIALAQALNGPTRAALCSLRAGGNRVGAEAVLTAHTGYPFAVDYSRGYPRYAPGRRGIDQLRDGAFRAALVVGSAVLDADSRAAFSQVTTVCIGPRASQSGVGTAVAIDTGVAGIHEGGMAYRMDEVPLRLRPPLEASHTTMEVLGRLADAIHRELRGRSG